jgi:hypothetical protein
MLLYFVLEHSQDVVLLADFIVTEVQCGECLCEVVSE